MAADIIPPAFVDSMAINMYHDGSEVGGGQGIRRWGEVGVEVEGRR